MFGPYPESLFDHGNTLVRVEEGALGLVVRNGDDERIEEVACARWIISICPRVRGSKLPG